MENGGGVFGGRTAHQTDTDPRQVNACIVDMTATTLQVFTLRREGEDTHTPLTVGSNKGYWYDDRFHSADWKVWSWGAHRTRG